tara:strand:- start:2548 stop:2919 length:372 start_codon:yes stop_codon:yes gene_type:complete
MTKYQKLDEPVFIQTVELINSKYGGEVYEIKMMGIKSQSQYYTYADPNNANWYHWKNIVDKSARKGIVLTNCKLKDPSKGLINADSQVTIEYMVTKEELHDHLKEYWNSQDQFGKWFGDEGIK